MYIDGTQYGLIVSIQVIWICRIMFEHVRTDVKQQRTRLVNVVAHGTLGHNKCYSSLAQVGMMKYILPRICDKLYSWYRKLEFGRVWYSMVEHGLTWRTCHGRLVSMVHWYSIVRYSMARAMADWPAGNQDSAALIITGDSPPSPNRLTPLYNTEPLYNTMLYHICLSLYSTRTIPKQARYIYGTCIK